MLNINQIFKKQKKFLIVIVFLTSLTLIYFSYVFEKRLNWAVGEVNDFKVQANKNEKRGINNYLTSPESDLISSNLLIVVKDSSGHRKKDVICQLYYIDKIRSSRINIFKKYSDNSGECYFFELKPDFLYGVELGRIIENDSQYFMLQNVDVGFLYPGKKLEKEVFVDVENE